MYWWLKISGKWGFHGTATPADLLAFFISVLSRRAVEKLPYIFCKSNLTCFPLKESRMVWAIIRVRSKSMCMCMSMSTSSPGSGKGAHMVERGLASTRSVAMIVDRVVLAWKEESTWYWSLDLEVLTINPWAAWGLVGQSQGHAGHEEQGNLGW